MAPGIDVGNLVCVTGAAPAGFALGWLESGPHCKRCVGWMMICWRFLCWSTWFFGDLQGRDCRLQSACSVQVVLGG